MATSTAPTITRDEYDQLRAHDYAGPGTPLDPGAPGAWFMALDPKAGTVLYTGATITEEA